ncbi:MAG: response regulator [bacterium]|nr:response regulator [bacterium]
MARILLADDDASSTEVMAAALAGEGHEVIFAADGLEAYEKALAEDLDMVFLDVMMPVFNGYEACEKIRKDPDIDPNLPIVFLTSADVDKRRLETIGANGHLPKRHMVQELRDVLVKHLGPKANPA